MKTIKRIGLLAAIAAATLTGCESSPESTVESFHDAVAKGEISEAKTYLHPNIKRMLGEQKLDAVLAEQAEQLQKCGGIESMKTEITGEGEIRSGTVTIDLKGDCPTKTENVKLQQFEGKWLIGSGK